MVKLKKKKNSASLETVTDHICQKAVTAATVAGMQRTAVSSDNRCPPKKAERQDANKTHTKKNKKSKVNVAPVTGNQIAKPKSPASIVAHGFARNMPRKLNLPRLCSSGLVTLQALSSTPTNPHSCFPWSYKSTGHARLGQTSLTNRLGNALACSPRAGRSHVAFTLQSCIFGLSRNLI